MVRNPVATVAGEAVKKRNKYVLAPLGDEKEKRHLYKRLILWPQSQIPEQKKAATSPFD